MRELSLEEVEMIVGGDCNYGGATYSSGAVVYASGGGETTRMQCNGTTWNTTSWS